MTVTTIRKNSEETATRELNDNQRRAAELLSLGLAQVRIARTLDIREATISEWRRLPEFQFYLAELRADARESFRESQAGLCQLATEALAEILVKGPLDLRLKAALAIYARGIDEGTPNSNATAVGAAILSALREGRHDQ